ncbi:MAG: 50S ribosomal protein L34 [Planctomycetota bacterium]|jgi:ribosomal protein L34
MKLHIRNSNTKRRRMLSFRKRMKTKGGRTILANQRRAHKPKQRKRLQRRRRKYKARH